MFFTQMRGDGFYRGWAYGPVPQIESDFEVRKLQSETTSDVRALALSAAAGPNAIRALDALIEKHPHEAWLMALRLLHSVENMKLGRVGGELSDSKRAQNQAAKIPSPERTKTKPNYTPAELEKCLALARRGQNLEPDNGFWDWMQVYFLMAGWRDEEAFRILKRGSHKAHFNDHRNDLQQAVRSARNAYYKAPQPPEATLFLLFNDMPDNFSAYAKQREMARIITWEGMKAQRRSDHQKALQIMTDMARLHYTASREAKFYMDLLVYHVMADLPLSRAGERDIIAAKRIRYGDPQNFEKRARLRARQVQNYASAHGQAVLGREMAALTMEDGKRRDKLQRAFKAQTAFQGLDRRPLRWSISFYWASALLFLLLVLLVFWWLIIGGALRLAHVPEIKIETNDVRRSVLTATLGIALFWSLAFGLGAGWGLLLMDILNQSPVFIGAGFFFLLVGFLWPTALSSWMVKRSARKRENLAQGIMLHGVRERVTSVWGRFRLSSFLLISGLYILAGAMAFWWFFAASAQDNQATWLRVFELSDSDFPLPPVINHSVRIFPLWPQLLFGSCLALLWLRELFAPDKSRVTYQLRCWHAVLSHLVVISSVSYLVLLAASVPLRERAEIAVNQYIERGEVASMLQNWKS